MVLLSDVISNDLDGLSVTEHRLSKTQAYGSCHTDCHLTVASFPSIAAPKLSIIYWLQWLDIIIGFSCEKRSRGYLHRLFQGFAFVRIYQHIPILIYNTYWLSVNKLVQHVQTFCFPSSLA